MPLSGASIRRAKLWVRYRQFRAARIAKYAMRPVQITAEKSKLGDALSAANFSSMVCPLNRRLTTRRRDHMSRNAALSVRTPCEGVAF
jgi:hypothetical protein